MYRINSDISGGHKVCYSMEEATLYINAMKRAFPSAHWTLNGKVV